MNLFNGQFCPENLLQYLLFEFMNDILKGVCECVMLWREVKINDTNFNTFYREVIFEALGEMMWSIGKEETT